MNVDKERLLALGRQLQADFIVLTEVVRREPEIVLQTLFSQADGQQGPNFSYCVCEAPCREVYRYGFLYESSAIQKTYSSDRALSKFSLNSYLGALLGDVDSPLGHVAFLWHCSEPDKIVENADLFVYDVLQEKVVSLLFS